MTLSTKLLFIWPNNSGKREQILLLTCKCVEVWNSGTQPGVATPLPAALSPAAAAAVTIMCAGAGLYRRVSPACRERRVHIYGKYFQRVSPLCINLEEVFLFFTILHADLSLCLATNQYKYHKYLMSATC